MKNITIFLILAAVIFSAFGNALFNGFVWDDRYLVVENPFIRHVEFVPKYFSGDLSSSTSASYMQSGYYRPLSLLSFLVDYQIWHLWPLGYHLTNIILHLLNACFVYLIVLALCQNRGVGLLTSIIFAVHPVQVEAVTPVFNRMGVQSAFFMLLALFLFIKSKRLSKTGFAIGVLGATFLGLLSKEDAIILPFLFLLYDYFYLRQVNGEGRLIKKRAIFYISCFLVCGLYLVIRSINISRSLTFPFFGFDNPAKYNLAPTFFTHILSVFKILGGNFLRAVFPANLSPVYIMEPAQRIIEPLVVLGFLVAIGFIAIVRLFRNRHKEIGFFAALFLIGILPTSNLIPLSYEYIARDRFLYFPIIGLSFLTAFCVKFILTKFNENPIVKTTIKSTVVAIIFGMMLSSSSYNYNWRADFILWRYALQKAPQSPLVHLNLAQVFLRDKNLSRAEAEFDKFLVLSNGKNVAGDFIYSTKLGLASIRLLTGKYNEAIPLIEESFSVAQNVGIVPFAAYEKLGLAYAYLNDNVRAEENLKKSLSYNKDFINARYNLGVFYYYRGEYQKSKEQLKIALELDSDFVDGLIGLGLACIKEGRNEEAQQLFLRALKINPQSDMANYYSQMFNVK